MTRGGLVLAVALGCGSVDSHDHDAGMDGAGGGGDGSPADAPIDVAVADAGPRCDPSQPFGSPAALTGLNTFEHDEQARLTTDELTVYYSAYRAGDWNIYRATRSSLQAAFANGAPLAHVSDENLQRAPSLTADELFLYLDTYGGDYDLSFAERASTTVDFGDVMLLATVNGTAIHDSDPFILPDHGALYFTRDPGDVGMADIYRAARGAGGFATPVPVSGTELNTSGMDTSPVVSPDELTIFFASIRTGGAGNYDVYMATRTSTASAFGAAENVAAVNTDELDVPSWISADGCVLYFTRNDVSTQHDVYSATRGL